MIDIGANLTNKRFHHDIGDVLRDAVQAGVEQVMVTGTSLEGSAAALALVKQCPDLLKGTAGVCILNHERHDTVVCIKMPAESVTSKHGIHLNRQYRTG